MLVIKGQRINIPYKNSNLEGIIIDSYHMNLGRPTVGVEFKIIENIWGISESTLNSWVSNGINYGDNFLKLPSGHLIQYSYLLSTKIIELSECLGLLNNLTNVNQNITKELSKSILWFNATYK